MFCILNLILTKGISIKNTMMLEWKNIPIRIQKINKNWRRSMNATKARHMKPIAVAWRIADIGILIINIGKQRTRKANGSGWRFAKMQTYKKQG